MFKINDRVYYGKHIGVVFKITDKAVHVRYNDGNFQKFHSHPTHHMQTPLT